MSSRLRVPRVTFPRAVVVLVVLALIGAGAGFALGSAGDRQWQSSRQALIRVWSIDSLVLSGQTADVSNVDLVGAATVVTSADVLTASVAALAEPGLTESELADAVTSTPSATSDFVTITANARSAAEADRRAQAVATAFVAVVRQKVLASAARIAAVTAGSASSDIQQRAIAVSALDPVQIYRTQAPVRSGLATGTAVAGGGVAGLALAALLIVLATFAAPRLRRPADVAHALRLPSLAWSRHTSPLVDDGLAADLIRAAGRGSVAVCPARPQDVRVADEFAAWLVATTPAAIAGGGERPGTPTGPDRYSGTALGSVVRLDSPVDTLAVARPAAAVVDVTVLVTATGTPTETVVAAATLLADWRPVDAVVLVG